MNQMKAWQGSYGIGPLSKHTGIVSPAYLVLVSHLIGIKIGVFADITLHVEIRSNGWSVFRCFALRLPIAFAYRVNLYLAATWDARVVTFALPPLSEQTAIVRYLNYFDRRIRRYMAVKAKANRAIGRAEASHHSPCCYTWPRPRCASQGFRRRVAGEGAGALDSCCSQADVAARFNWEKSVAESRKPINEISKYQYLKAPTCSMVFAFDSRMMAPKMWASQNDCCTVWHM